MLSIIVLRKKIGIGASLPIINNVLVLINLYCNVLILIYLKNHLNIAGRLSLHK